ncbi:uncharacterized protein LOC118485839 [Helianthus annuus]|uniref:uncharacterized protein LOC118485839 n=1 Tax=Helianthus annuus TaxID=4232 RepID=UPI001652C23E|nr:uncharacterized protein LOC118485839 [Helianthus annuus]
MEHLQDNPKIPIKAVQEQLQRKFEVGVSKQKAYRAKQKAVMQLNGDYNSQYGLLRAYVAELMNTNLGTTVKFELEPPADPESTERKFKRVYVCLGALKQGFKAIGRDMLGLDGAFIKGPYPGQVLSAVGVDPNNGIYPVSYAIVEAETLDSWTWFLECLGDDLDLEANSNFTFLSDRQKGIIPAIMKVFPFAKHRFCLRHIYENMRLQFKGKAFKDLLWKCATATTIVEFEKEMDALKSFNRRATSDMLLNNMCEVFNSKILEGRDKPIIAMLKFIREYCMRRIVNVLQLIERSDGLLTPYATELFEEIKKDATSFTL